GLAAALAAELAGTRRLLGVGGVAPYCLPAQAVREHLQSAGDAADAFQAFPGNDYVEHSDFSPSSLRLLRALGTIAYNLHGAKISPRLLSQLASFEAPAALRSVAAGLWLAGDGALDLNGPLDHDQDRFLRHPQRQEALLARVSEWALDRSLAA